MSAVRFVASKTPTGSCWMFHLNCHVKTHVNSQRGGIVSIKDSVIELNIAAPPRDGEANKAVRELIANVLGVPKSDIEVTKGLKSREKTIVLRTSEKAWKDAHCPDDLVNAIRQRLSAAI